MYRLAICEDEAVTRHALEALCGDILTEQRLEHALTAFSSAEALKAAVTAGAVFDLLLLDIQLGGMTGLELAKDLRRRGDQVSIVFITGCADYLLEGYTVQPLLYLMKPVKREELATAIATDLRLHHLPKTVVLRTGGRSAVLRLDALRYAESLGHTVRIHMTEKTLDFPVTLSELEKLLPGQRFCRCHNSFLVNIDHVELVSRTEVALRDGSRVPIGRRYFAQAQEKFVQYINQ